MIEVFFSDVHFPYHDPEAWELFLGLVKKTAPDIVVAGGDIIDMYSISSFLRDPALVDIEAERQVARRELARVVKAAPKARRIFIPGNHEYRLEKLRRGPANALATLAELQVQNFLNLKELGFEYVPYRKGIQIGDLWHFHGDQFGGGKHPAERLYNRVHGNVIVGHHHRADVHYQNVVGGDVHKAIVNPCLCSLDVEYTTLPNWTQGCTVIEYSKSGKFQAHSRVFYREDGVLKA